ncbi:MAG: hypothetical protein VB093_14485 [Propionicimonas sp.]|nr:hypothetical protein [Propionicimonas sp.]
MAKLLHPFDLELTAWPRARFCGSVEIAGHRFSIDQVSGTRVHYWGRRLPDSWLWVSGGLGDEDGAVEAALFQSRIWGALSPVVNAGFVAATDGRRKAQIITPVHGAITARGVETAFEINARGGGHALHLAAHTSQSSYNDLGEGVHQTLLGDLFVDDWGSCSGHAGLEMRGGDLVRSIWTR